MDKNIVYINNIKIKYINKIKNIIFLQNNATIYQRLKFNSIVSAEGNPSNAIDLYISKSFYLYLFSYALIGFGIIFSILSFLTSLFLLLVGIIFISIGLFEVLKPEKVFIFLVNSDFGKIERGTYENRYRIIRSMYQSYIISGNPFFIDDSVKVNKYVYLFFKFLNYEEGVSSEKINKASLYFSSLDVQKFLKDLSSALENQSIKKYYEGREDELKLRSESTMKEKITAQSTIATVLVFAEAVLGLMIGVGTIVQSIMTQVYNSILTNFSGISLAQVSSELTIFQLIVGLPPIYYGYIALLLISLIALYLFNSFAKNAGVM
jgi:hypothetical protein